jgi:subtilisin-like proprotein convertase family protein
MFILDRVAEALVYLDVEAQNTTELSITLVSPVGKEVKLFEVPADPSTLGPGRQPAGAELGVIRGVAHPMPLVDDEGKVQLGLKQLVGALATGTWRLRVENKGAGLATLKSWSLWLTAGNPS